MNTSSMEKRFELKLTNKTILIGLLVLVSYLQSEAQSDVKKINQSPLKELIKEVKLPTDLPEKYKGLDPNEAFFRNRLENGTLQERIEFLEGIIRGERENLKIDKSEPGITEEQRRLQTNETEKRIKDLEKELKKLRNEPDSNRQVI